MNQKENSKHWSSLDFRFRFRFLQKMCIRFLFVINRKRDFLFVGIFT